MKELLLVIFKKLHERILIENSVRRISGAMLIANSKVEVLGQTSLLLQPELTYSLSLAQTGDLDAFLEADYFVKKELKLILQEHGFIYDEDSPLIYIPPGSRFLPFLDLEMLEVSVIDPESALVSKAVKSPEKNIQLIRQAIVSGEFPHLVERILKAGGDLNLFT